MSGDGGVWGPDTDEHSYVWPRHGHDDDVTYVLAGRMAELPQKRSKVVRIFLSSTFTDTYVERNALIQTTYPRLKQYCKDKYDLEFQVVDMRWGVRNEASDDHSASGLCMRELSSCQQLSVGPTFVTLIGNRYGSRPLPVHVPHEEMKAIISTLQTRGDTECLPLIEKWYRLDENALPPEYVLQPLSTIGRASMGAEALAELEQKTEETIRRELLEYGRKQWRPEEPKVVVALRQGADICIQEGSLTKTEALFFTRSVTEEEIEQGLLQDSNPDAHCLCFIRDLTNINLKHKKAWRFIDQENNGVIDRDAAVLINQLKEEKIPQVLSSKNIFHYEVPWSDDEGVNEQDHRDYIREFCEKVEAEIKRLVDNGYDAGLAEKRDALYEEVLEHAHQGAAKCERFHGRTDVLSEIHKYITSDNNEPLVIDGQSGVGKTSVMAKAATSVCDWLKDDTDTHVIVRFLGTTPSSSDISATLASVTTQLLRSVMKINSPEIPQSFNDQRTLFHDTILKLQNDDNKHKRLVVILDSLDQLSSIHRSYQMQWLPKFLPPNVKIIVSTLPDDHSILHTLKLLNFNKSNYLSVLPLDQKGSQDILDLWLSQQNRIITDEQRTKVEDVIKNDIRPLYLKLVFDEILAWRSYQTEAELSTIQPDIESSILQLFKRLEIKHGGKLVQRAFGYLTASENGLSELEMEDLLSLDDDVLNSVFEYHLPPIRRLPSILWARVRADLAEYIVDREAAGARVMAWYHRQFIENTYRYFNVTYPEYEYHPRHQDVSDRDLAAITVNMFDYYLGRWANGKTKPFMYTDSQIYKYNIQYQVAEADRMVPQQSSIYRRLDGCIGLPNPRFNKRKVAALTTIMKNVIWTGQKFNLDTLKLDYGVGLKMEFTSEHQRLTRAYMRYTAEAMEAMVFDFEFLLAWGHTGPWGDITSFIFRNEYDVPKKYARELARMSRVILDCEAALFSNPFTLGPQIAGRMMPYYGTLPLLTKLIDSIEGEGRSTCALLAPHHNLERPGGALLSVVTNHTSPVRRVAVINGSHIMSVSDRIVHTVMPSGRVVLDTRARGQPPGDRFRWVTAALQETLEGDKYEDTYIVIASLTEHPWIYVMQADDGLVRQEIHMEDYESDQYTLDGLEIFDKYLVVFSNNSPNVYVYDAYDGSEIGAIKGSGCEKVLTVSFIVFAQQAHLMIVMTVEEKLSLRFYHIGEVSKYDESTDGVVRFNLYDVCLADDWYKTEVHRVELNNSAKYCCHTVTEHLMLVAFAFEDGTMTYLLDGGAMGQDSDSSHSSSESSNSSDDIVAYVVNGGGRTPRKEGVGFKEKIDALKSCKTFLAHEKIGAVQYTVSTDYFPLHSLSCMRTSVHRELLLVVGCSERMLAVSELVDGGTKLRVKKRYSKALFSPKGKLLYAYADWTIDVFAVHLGQRAAIVPYASVDAHTQPIVQLGSYDFDAEVMAYTAGEDGSLKCWNMKKLAKETTTKFNRSVGVLDYIITGCGSSPENTVAIVTFRPPYDSYLEIWSVMTGKRIEAVSCKRSVCSAAFLGHKNRFTALAYTTSGELLACDITDIVLEGTPEGATRSNKRSLRQTTVFENDGKELYGLLHVTRDHVLIIAYHKILVVIDKTSLEVLTKQELFESDVVDTFMHETGQLMVALAGSDVYHLIYVEKGNATANKTEYRTFAGQKGGTARLVATCSEDQTTLQLLERQHGHVIMETEWGGSGNRLMALTADDKYLVKVVDKEVELIRVQDKRLLARVTLYDAPHTVNITENGWFVVFGMADKRLLVLMISDPQNPGHDIRSTAAHCSNPALDVDADCNSDDEDEEAPIKPLLHGTDFIDMDNKAGDRDCDDETREDKDTGDGGEPFNTTKLCVLQ